MLSRQGFEYRFVKNIPDQLEPGILYISMEYTTATHSCFCGCGEEVVTPFSPTDWKMTFDGETVSLYPSIGNWTLKCRSHYVLDRSKIFEAGDWSESAIAAERRRDRAAKENYYGEQQRERRIEPVPVPSIPAKKKESWWARFLRFFTSSKPSAKNETVSEKEK